MERDGLVSAIEGCECVGDGSWGVLCVDVSVRSEWWVRWEGVE